MNQIMPVGKGVLFAMDEHVRPDQFEHLRELWNERFPEVPIFVVGPAQIVVRDDQPMLFEFTGTSLTETFVSEFQRWWEEVTRGG